MKKSWKSLTALLAASLLCLGMFAGCSEAEESSSSESSSESSSSTSTSSSSSSEEEEAAEDVVGEITYLGTSSLVVDVYEADSEITDYTDLEGIALTDSGDSETVTLEDDAVYQSVSSGVASDITLDDLAEGDMVAVTTDEDGVQTIIVLEVETAGDSSSSISSDGLHLHGGIRFGGGCRRDRCQRGIRKEGAPRREPLGRALCLPTI